MARPFRFAVQVSRAEDAAQWRALCRRVEALGYSTLYVADHLGTQWGPLVALTAAAAATETLRIGGLVFNNDFRHPVVLAREAATLDLVSDGRLELGLGAGWLAADYDASGILLDPPGVRIGRLAEALTIVKALLSTGSCDFAGEHYRVRATARRRPHVPICVGGGGRHILTLAAQEADIVGVNAKLTAGAPGPALAATATAERFDERLAWIRAAAGPRLADLELQCYASDTIVTDDRVAAVSRVAASVSLTADEAADCPLLLIGTVDELCDQLVARRERWGLSYWVVDAAGFEAFAPVVARMAGR